MLLKPQEDQQLLEKTHQSDIPHKELKNQEDQSDMLNNQATAPESLKLQLDKPSKVIPELKNQLDTQLLFKVIT